MTFLGGIDIGGTNCGVCIGNLIGQQIQLMDQERFPTPATPGETLVKLIEQLRAVIDRNGSPVVEAIGISCGGPLDSRSGIIFSPPNLPGWDRVDVVTPIHQEFGVPVSLQNDANAGALAEWLWGAGRGSQNMVFLTFGTGMGAGLVLNGRLYAGTNGMAGEVGHIRLERNGPSGYGKNGSFEGFCSGGGIARQAAVIAREALLAGITPAFCPTPADLPEITAEKVGLAAQAGDATAVKIFETVGIQLGQGLALLVDLLNPEKIVIGPYYARHRALLEPHILRVMREEALACNLSVCEVVPASLGEQIDEMASLSVAYNQIDRDSSQ